jgi:hypothetical protein
MIAYVLRNMSTSQSRAHTPASLPRKACTTFLYTHNQSSIVKQTTKTLNLPSNAANRALFINLHPCQHVQEIFWGKNDDDQHSGKPHATLRFMA